jgi:hypothetical protein
MVMKEISMVGLESKRWTQTSPNLHPSSGFRDEFNQVYIAISILTSLTTHSHTLLDHSLYFNHVLILFFGQYNTYSEIFNTLNCLQTELHWSR